MSVLRKYTEGLGFRTNTPSFDAGDEITVFVTGVESGTPIARIGDSTLRLENGSPGPRRQARAAPRDRLRRGDPRRRRGVRPDCRR